MKMVSLEKKLKEQIKTKPYLQWFNGVTHHNNYPNIGVYAKDLEKYTLHLESMLIDELRAVAQQIREIAERFGWTDYVTNQVVGLLVEQEEKNSVPLRDTLVEGASDFEHQDEGLGSPSSQRAKDGRAKSPLLRPETVD